MSYGSVTRIPKGLHHLEPAAKNKFALRYPARAPRPSKAYVQPQDRVARWNIVPGDKVRVMVGKAKDKFIDETKGATSGWKVYTVHSVDLGRSRVYLNGLTNKKANPIRPPPANLEELGEEDRNQWLQQRNFIDSRRAVQYSNVQLCVEDKGPDSVFATRIATSEPHFVPTLGRFQWKRFAANLTGETSLDLHPVRGQVTIPWPKIDKLKKIEPTAVDTNPRAVSETTLALGPSSSIPASLVPTSMRAPLPKDQLWANEYVFNPAGRPDAQLQAAMPLYLGEELSPRFARAKKMKGWKARREMEAIARDEEIHAAVDAWEAGGRDAGLEEILATNAVNLEGATIRPRTRKEIRDAAGAEFDQLLAATKGESARAVAAGERWDYSNHRLVHGDKGLQAIRKRVRKARKARKITERLENLTLSEEKNQVIPEGLRTN